MKNAVFAGVAVAGALFVAPAPLAAAPGEPISGLWSGEVDDTVANAEYVAEIFVKDKLEKGEKGGESYYPVYECGGDLILKRHREGSPKYIFREKLTVGVDACIDDGKVTLKREGRKLSYRWTIKGEDGSADGLLQRVRPE